MKKFLLSVLVLACCCMSNAQITLLHTFQGESEAEGVYPINYFGCSPWFEYVQEPLNCYYFIDRENRNIKCYDSNFQLVTNSSFASSPIFANDGISSAAVSMFGRHIVNTDDKIELIVNLRLIDNSYHSYVINEDGDIIYDLNSVEILRNTLHKVGNQLRVLGASNPYETAVYALGGNYNPSTMVTYTQPGSFPNPYPNPSRNTITIPYTLPSGETSQLRVFNMNGQLLETFNIGSDFDKIQINVSNYPKGTYIYTYNNVTKKFVVQ